mgnify:CR=1 FL=1
MQLFSPQWFLFVNLWWFSMQVSSTIITSYFSHQWSSYYCFTSFSSSISIVMMFNSNCLIARTLEIISLINICILLFKYSAWIRIIRIVNWLNLILMTFSFCSIKLIIWITMIKHLLRLHAVILLLKWKTLLRKLRLLVLLNYWIRAFYH